MASEEEYDEMVRTMSDEELSAWLIRNLGQLPKEAIGHSDIKAALALVRQRSRIRAQVLDLARRVDGLEQLLGLTTSPGILIDVLVQARRRDEAARLIARLTDLLEDVVGPWPAGTADAIDEGRAWIGPNEQRVSVTP